MARGRKTELRRSLLVVSHSGDGNCVQVVFSVPWMKFWENLDYHTVDLIVVLVDFFYVAGSEVLEVVLGEKLRV